MSGWGRWALCATLAAVLVGGDEARAGANAPPAAPSRAVAPVNARQAASTLPTDLKRFLDQIQARYEGLKDFRARFTQESRVQTAPTVEKASGEVFFRRPGRMRWNYEKPEPQQIVINGDKLWQYVPKDKQVVVQGFDAARVEYTFLTGVGKLERDFKPRWAHPKMRPGDPLVYVDLFPRDEQASFSKVTLGVSPGDHRILATEVTDLFGNVTVIRFEDLRDNLGLSNETFVFKVPKGVDVIDTTTGHPAS
jgi:outer membrane lipoprotein carrier protein